MLCLYQAAQIYDLVFSFYKEIPISQVQSVVMTVFACICTGINQVEKSGMQTDQSVCLSLNRYFSNSSLAPKLAMDLHRESD